jgi:hypothetical protein
MPTPTHHKPPAAADHSDRQLDEGLREYQHQRRVFQAHSAVFAAGMVAIFAVNLLTNLAAGITGQWSAWWSVWALLGWGLGIAVHGFVVWLSRPASDLSLTNEGEGER